MRVLLQRRQRGARRQGEVELGEAHARRTRRIIEPARERDERVLELAGEDRVGMPLAQEVLGVQRGVVAVEADVRGGIRGAHARRGGDAHAQRRVHGHRHGHQSRAPDLVRVEGLDGQVHHGGPVARALEKRRRPRHRKRLMPELVAGDEQDLAGTGHGLSLRRAPCYG